MWIEVKKWTEVGRNYWLTKKNSAKPHPPKSRLNQPFQIFFRYVKREEESLAHTLPKRCLLDDFFYCNPLTQINLVICLLADLRHAQWDISLREKKNLLLNFDWRSEAVLYGSFRFLQVKVYSIIVLYAIRATASNVNIVKTQTIHCMQSRNSLRKEQVFVRILTRPTNNQSKLIDEYIIGHQSLQLVGKKLIEGIYPVMEITICVIQGSDSDRGTQISTNLKNYWIITIMKSSRSFDREKRN